MTDMKQLIAAFRYFAKRRKCWIRIVKKKYDLYILISILFSSCSTVKGSIRTFNDNGGFVMRFGLMALLLTNSPNFRDIKPCGLETEAEITASTSE